ncbi:MAG: NMD3-related protein [Ignisphaera sp.]|uniref:Nmd3 N-terminal domain-containing protein n=1 Tax=Ignisphaera aggregans TaxID=334771 RepID=A0A7C4NM54_9CREN
MTRFCANCGVNETEGIPIIDGLCVKCYVKLKDIIKIPNTIEISTCSRCGALLVGGRWFYPSTAEEAQEIARKIITETIKHGEDITIGNVVVELLPPNYTRACTCIDLIIRNKYKYLLKADVNIKWVKGLCHSCFRRAGISFDAVVQLRFVHMDESAKRFIEEIEKIFQDHIIDVEEHSNGFDIKVISHRVAHKIVDLAKKMWKKIKVIESFGDIRHSKDGSRRGKLYISVRIINLRVNDYVVLDGKAYTVVYVDEETIRILDSNGDKKTIHIEDLISYYQKARARSR